MREKVLDRNFSTVMANMQQVEITMETLLATKKTFFPSIKRLLPINRISANFVCHENEVDIAKFH